MAGVQVMCNGQLSFGQFNVGRASFSHQFTFFAVILLALQGCVGIQSFPLAARAGDTITIAAGSVDGMTTSNTTVKFVSDEATTFGDEYDLTSNIRVITKIYPDKTSAAWMTSNAAGIPPASGHGSWQSIIVLDLASAIPVGMGHFVITTSAYTGNSLVMTSISDTPVAIEILPGVGSANNFSYKFFGNVAGDLSMLKPGNQAIVANAANGGAQLIYGAINVVVNAAILDGEGSNLPDSDILIVPDDQPIDAFSQKQLSWSRTGDEISIHIISPVGKLSEIQARASIVIPEDASFTIPPTITSITYYDINGDVVAGPMPSIQQIP
ncbi:hypothetical protein MNBD_GAMMA06-386 [hydrothermal vent metagenome]|uniref:Uncharacterized protein n=1 Tax=hydrothermal vent metagenome TaxID=652676 RepID=A0A3B0WRV9_9ZZZZ